MGHEISREKQILHLTLLSLYSPLSLVYSSTNLHLKDAKQSHCTLHAVLNNWVYSGMTAADGVAVRLPDKSW